MTIGEKTLVSGDSFGEEVFTPEEMRTRPYSALAEGGSELLVFNKDIITNTMLKYDQGMKNK